MPPPTLRRLAGFRITLFLPFGRNEAPLRPANSRITRIVDRANGYRLNLAFRRLAAHLRNTRQIARFSSVNRRVAGSSPARGAKFRRVSNADLLMNRSPDRDDVVGTSIFPRAVADVRVVSDLDRDLRRA